MVSRLLIDVEIVNTPMNYLIAQERASSPLTPEPEVPDMKLQMKGKKETVIEKA